MCVAGRLPGAGVCVLFLFCLTFSTRQICALLTYDWDQLLSIQLTVDESLMADCIGEGRSPPPFLASVPNYLWRLAHDAPHRKRRRKRGCRGGIAVKLKTLPTLNRKSTGWLSSLPQAGAYDQFVSRCLSEEPCGWILPVGLSSLGVP